MEQPVRCYCVNFVMWALALSVPAVSAQAAVVFDNGVSVNNFSGGLNSDQDGTKRAADDFAFSQPTAVNSVQFLGLYVPSETPQAMDSFTLVFYADSSGQPDPGSVHAVVPIGHAARTQIDVPGIAEDIFEYNAVFDDVAFPAADRFWVSIFNDTQPDLNDTWIWIGADPPLGGFGNNIHISNDSGSTWSQISSSGSTTISFQLSGTTIPEPSSVAWLIGIGLIRICVNRRVGYQHLDSRTKG